MQRILIFFSILFFFSCKKSFECSDGAFCTNDLRYVIVSIVDTNTKAYQLDSFVSVLLMYNKILDNSSDYDSIELKTVQQNGKYMIASDLNHIMGLIRKSGADVRFTGYKNKVKIVDEIFKVGHDCCHVKMISGNTNIVITE